MRTTGRRWEITCACTYRYMALPFGCPPFFSCQASLAFSLLLPSLWHRVSPLHLWFISVFVCLFFCSHLLVPISISLPFFPFLPFFLPLLLSYPPPPYVLLLSHFLLSPPSGVPSFLFLLFSVFISVSTYVLWFPPLSFPSVLLLTWFPPTHPLFFHGLSLWSPATPPLSPSVPLCGVSGACVCFCLFRGVSSM